MTPTASGVDPRDRPVLVVGGGVSGLTCAVRLAMTGRPVTIAARELPPGTTSDVAAAVWYPYRAEPPDRVIHWSRTSYRTFRRLADDPATGVVMRPLIEFFRESAPDPWWGPAVPEWRRARSEELRPGCVDGYRLRVPVIDIRKYLPWLVDRFERLGGSVEQRELDGLDEAFDDHDVVVNCAGLGARELVGDPELVPIRGQVVRVENPGLEMVEIDERGPAGMAYVIPRGDDCVLGGTADEGQEETGADPETANAILERCRDLQPRLAEAKPVGGAVGLRPFRGEVRLEAARPAAGRLLVHNYGHGGAGVTLSWGCAEEVARIVTG